MVLKINISDLPETRDLRSTLGPLEVKSLRGLNIALCAIMSLLKVI
jgi:hypothetical protein